MLFLRKSPLYCPHHRSGAAHSDSRRSLSPMCAQTHTLAIKHSPESIQASLAFPQLCLGGKCQPSGCRGSLGGLNVSRHSLIQPGTQPPWNQPWDLSPRAQEEPDSLCLVRHSLAWSHINWEQLCFPASFPPGKGLKHMEASSQSPATW